MLNIVQTIGVIVAALVSAYAVTASEMNRRRGEQRARVERVYAAVLELMEAAVRVQEIQGQGPALEVAKRRLSAELQVVGRPLVSTDLLVRPTFTPQDIVNQSETAILEISRALDELAPRPLFAELWARASAFGRKTR